MNYVTLNGKITTKPRKEGEYYKFRINNIPAKIFKFKTVPTKNNHVTVVGELDQDIADRVIIKIKQLTVISGKLSE